MKRETPISPSSFPKTNDDAGETDDRPWTVREAAKFLGVSPQTVYLWVERKQIPHLRIMGRNIRFLDQPRAFPRFFSTGTRSVVNDLHTSCFIGSVAKQIRAIESYRSYDFQASVAFFGFSETQP